MQTDSIRIDRVDLFFVTLFFDCGRFLAFWNEDDKQPLGQCLKGLRPQARHLLTQTQWKLKGISPFKLLSVQSSSEYFTGLNTVRVTVRDEEFFTADVFEGNL